jgi:hypothetical protein
VDGLQSVKNNLVEEVKVPARKAMESLAFQEFHQEVEVVLALQVLKSFRVKSLASRRAPSVLLGRTPRTGLCPLSMLLLYGRRGDFIKCLMLGCPPCPDSLG